MSGVDKSKSAVLNLGGARSCNVKSGAGKILGGFKGPVWKSKCTNKGPGKECSFETNVCCKKVKACEDEPAKWDTSANWNVSCKKQVSGLTFGCSYK